MSARARPPRLSLSGCVSFELRYGTCACFAARAAITSANADSDLLICAHRQPLLKETWAGAIDTVGGATLATLLKACKEGGAVAATGMVASTDLPTTVFPFILRGVSLLGINAQGTSMSIRQEIWSKLAEEWKPAGFERLAFDCRLEKLNPEIDRILAGNQLGRVVVDLQ